MPSLSAQISTINEEGALKAEPASETAAARRGSPSPGAGVMGSSASSWASSASPPRNRRAGGGLNSTGGFAALAEHPTPMNQSFGGSAVSFFGGGGGGAAGVGSEAMLDEARQIYRAGVDMLRNSEERSDALWSCARTKSRLEQGEDMLREQVALDDRQRLMRTVNNVHGEELAFRSHVAKNIQKRLKDEFKREAGRGPALAVNQQCINIKKQLDVMAKARGELRGLRSKVQLFCEGDDDNTDRFPDKSAFSFHSTHASKLGAASESPGSPSRRGSSTPALRRRSMSKNFELPAVSGAHR